MSKPITVDLPHNLGREEAKRRIQARAGTLSSYIPGGTADVQSSWAGDRMNLVVRALGQTVNSHIDVEEKLVRLQVELPAFLGMFAGTIEGVLRHTGRELLEDKSKK